MQNLHPIQGVVHSWRGQHRLPFGHESSALAQYALLARFSVALRAEAPMVRIAWRALDVMALTTHLERGEVDLALAAPEHAPAAMRQRRLYEEDYAVIARQGHPGVQGDLGLDVFCALDHVVVSPQGGGFAGLLTRRSRRSAAAAPSPCPRQAS